MTESERPLRRRVRQLAAMATPGKRERNKAANRAAILQAAETCFHDTGYDAVTIRDVIRLSGLAAGTFYNYFPDKASVFRALVDGELQTLQQRLHAARVHAEDLASFFYESFLSALSVAREHPHFFEMMFRNEPTVRAFYNDNILGLIMQSVRTDLHAAIERGLAPQLDVDALTAVSFGAGYELIRLVTEQPNRDLEATARFVTQMFIHGLPAQVAPPQLIRIGPRLLKGAAR